MTSKMNRAELARELRRIADDLKDIAEAAAPAWCHEVRIVELAAAALEEEDRDTKYQLLVKAVENMGAISSWKLVGEPPYGPTLIGTTGCLEDGRDGYWSRIDDALDAWLEEREGKSEGEAK